MPEPPERPEARHARQFLWFVGMIASSVALYEARRLWRWLTGG